MQQETESTDVTGPMRNLIQRLSVLPRAMHAQVIVFIAARSGEGTSTIAMDCAQMMTAETGQKVLLIQTANASLGIVDAVLTGKSPVEAIMAGPNGIYTAFWMRDEKYHSKAGKVLHDDAVWQVLSDSFNAIIIDAPSLQTSFDGVMLAAKADATILVVEAEKTPEPVVINLRDTLTASGATIAGVVMNKRRYYIPEKIYSRL